MDKSKQGAIYFSLGSNLKTIYLPDNIRKIFLDVFGKLPYNVLFKWENDTLPGKPDNVFLSKWLPQLTVLGKLSTRICKFFEVQLFIFFIMEGSTNYLKKLN